MNCNEEWRDVVGFEDYYSVSSRGIARELRQDCLGLMKDMCMIAWKESYINIMVIHYLVHINEL